MTTFRSRDDLPFMMTVGDLAELLQVNKDGLYQWIKANDVPRIQYGNKILIPKEHFLEWLEQQTGITPKKDVVSPKDDRVQAGSHKKILKNNTDMPA